MPTLITLEDGTTYLARETVSYINGELARGARFVEFQDVNDELAATVVRADLITKLKAYNQ